jgi:uncharacterized protein (DUF2164 family)
MASGDVRENAQNSGTRRMPKETLQQDESQEVPHGVAEYLYKEREREKKIQFHSELRALSSRFGAQKFWREGMG